MNFNISVICDTCKTQTNCRLGMSNRSLQPMRFRCESCGSPVDITLIPDFENVGIEIEIAGAERVEASGFDEEVSFVDMHIDFPVSFGEYVMGLTPFMAANMRVGHEAMQMHSVRVDYLNDVYEARQEIKELFTLYSNDKKELFQDKALEFIDSSMACETQLDQNRALYFAIEKAFFPFAEPERNVDAVDQFTKILIKLEQKNASAIYSFVQEIVDRRFLKNFQTDCLEIYPKIIDIEMMLRPALFLDFDTHYKNCPIPYRVSTHEFQDVKDLYKDITEIVSRALVLIAGINNIDKRGDAHCFLSGKQYPKHLDKFADMPLGQKLDCIDDSWYPIDSDVLDNQLRNSVAHYKAEYDDITQEITYYPKLEGLEQSTERRMIFLDFSRQILTGFRELHRTNHLAKCLFVFYYLRMLGEQGTPFDV